MKTGLTLVAVVIFVVGVIVGGAITGMAIPSSSSEVKEETIAVKEVVDVPKFPEGIYCLHGDKDAKVLFISKSPNSGRLVVRSIYGLSNVIYVEQEALKPCPEQ